MGGYFAVVSTTTSPDASTTVARAPDVPKSRPRKRSPSASADVRCSEDDAVAVVVAAAAAVAAAVVVAKWSCHPLGPGAPPWDR